MSSYASCQRCAKKYRSKALRLYKGEMLCYFCFMKETTLIGSPGKRQFNEPLTETVNYFLNLTAGQLLKLKKRLKSLQPARSGGMQISKYMRKLVLQDLTSKMEFKLTKEETLAKIKNIIESTQGNIRVPANQDITIGHKQGFDYAKELIKRRLLNELFNTP